MHDSRHQAMISPLRLETVEIFNSKKMRYRIYSIRADMMSSVRATYSAGKNKNIWHANPNPPKLTIAEGMGSNVAKSETTSIQLRVPLPTQA